MKVFQLTSERTDTTENGNEIITVESFILADDFVQAANHLDHLCNNFRPHEDPKMVREVLTVVEDIRKASNPTD